MRALTTITLILVTLTLNGCGDTSRPMDLPKLYSCTITVTQDDKPLPDAYIELIAADGTAGKYSAGTFADANGKAVMTTYAHKGVPAGRYKVVIAKNIEDDFVYGKDEYGEQSLVSSTSYRTVEPKYSSAETTPFEIEITGKEKNVTQTFDVGKAVKLKISNSEK